MPAEVVAVAGKPAFSKMRALATSHAFGRISTPGPRWNCRNWIALLAWDSITSLSILSGRFSSGVAAASSFAHATGCPTVPRRASERHRGHGTSHVDLTITGMATSTVADAKSEGTLAKPRPLTRLLRHVLPYWWPFLVSVTLMALVGLLDAGRVLLTAPIFYPVLNPASP